MTVKRAGFGMLLGVSIEGTTATLTDIAEVVDGLSRSGVGRDEIETTLLADEYKSFAPGQTDPGGASFMIAYDSTSTEIKKLGTLQTQKVPMPLWRITYPFSASTTESLIKEKFNAFLNDRGQEVVKDGLITCSIGLKGSGDPGYATS